ncbi:helix-turn-helix transcriptional regulator [Epilithonimonas sp.]|uniref:helix-turn-helix transcriptional regulator n=1 Tax=Epilithonimonas sp. TaxID=2894511 RepID=UPI002899981A|nr:helix-turn-helix transcriptional regulator [Epilithonimonas sp.]
MQYGNNKNIELPPVELTKREIEILSLLALGNSAKQISTFLEISYHTITTHHRNIFEKTNCTKISELIKKALEWGLIKKNDI